MYVKLHAANLQRKESEQEKDIRTVYVRHGHDIINPFRFAYMAKHKDQTAERNDEHAIRTIGMLFVRDRNEENYTSGVTFRRMGTARGRMRSDAGERR